MTQIHPIEIIPTWASPYLTAQPKTVFHLHQQPVDPTTKYKVTTSENLLLNFIAVSTNYEAIIQTPFIQLVTDVRLPLGLYLSLNIVRIGVEQSEILIKKKTVRKTL